MRLATSLTMAVLTGLSSTPMAQAVVPAPPEVTSQFRYAYQALSFLGAVAKI